MSVFNGVTQVNRAVSDPGTDQRLPPPWQLSWEGITTDSALTGTTGLHCDLVHGDGCHQINGNHTTTITGNHNHTVEQDQSLAIQGNLTHTITGNATRTYQSSHLLTVIGSHSETHVGDSSYDYTDKTETTASAIDMKGTDNALIGEKFEMVGSDNSVVGQELCMKLLALSLTGAEFGLGGFNAEEHGMEEKLKGMESKLKGMEDKMAGIFMLDGVAIIPLVIGDLIGDALFADVAGVALVP